MLRSKMLRRRIARCAIICGTLSLFGLIMVGCSSKSEQQQKSERELFAHKEFTNPGSLKVNVSWGSYIYEKWAGMKIDGSETEAKGPNWLNNVVSVTNEYTKIITDYIQMPLEEKKKLIQEAQKRGLEQIGKKIVIEGFYVGMPAVDCLAMCDLNGLSQGFITMQLKEDRTLSCIAFGRGCAPVLIGCGQNKLMYTLISRYVKGHNGVSEMLEDITEISHEEYDDMLAECYNSPQLKTKVRYCPQTSLMEIYEY